MSLSKHHYESIAKIVRETNNANADIMYKLAYYFTTESSDFNPTKFIEACQPTGDLDLG